MWIWELHLRVLVAYEVLMAWHGCYFAGRSQYKERPKERSSSLLASKDNYNVMRTDELIGLLCGVVEQKSQLAQSRALRGYHLLSCWGRGRHAANLTKIGEEEKENKTKSLEKKVGEWICVSIQVPVPGWKGKKLRTKSVCSGRRKVKIQREDISTQDL